MIFGTYQITKDFLPPVNPQNPFKRQRTHPPKNKEIPCLIIFQGNPTKPRKGRERSFGYVCFFEYAKNSSPRTTTLFRRRCLTFTSAFTATIPLPLRAHGRKLAHPEGPPSFGAIAKPLALWEVSDPKIRFLNRVHPKGCSTRVANPPEVPGTEVSGALQPGECPPGQERPENGFV